MHFICSLGNYLNIPLLQRSMENKWKVPYNLNMVILIKWTNMFIHFQWIRSEHLKNFIQSV